MHMQGKSAFGKIDGGTWCPVLTLPKNEKKLQTVLCANGVPVYLPLVRHVNLQPVMSKGKSYCYRRVLQVPMFRNYLFANITPDLRSELGHNRSVMRILPMTEVQEEILLDELNVIRRLEQFSEKEEIDVTAGLARGVKVRFTEGSFAGWEGVVLDFDREGMVCINITSIEAAVKIRYPAVWCRRVDRQE